MVIRIVDRLSQGMSSKLPKLQLIILYLSGNFVDIFLSYRAKLRILMVSSLKAQGISANTVAPIQRLARAMMVSNGQFSLILACCNSVSRQQQILSWLKEFSEANFQEILIPSTAQTLYTTISSNLESKQPEALMVRGLESVVAINQLIICTNIMRDELRKQFKFPMILWVTDDILKKLIWLAPDLKDWAASTIRFEEVPRKKEQGRKDLQQVGDSNL
jgi:hypothetical protein